MYHRDPARKQKILKHFLRNAFHKGSTQDLFFWEQNKGKEQQD